MTIEKRENLISLYDVYRALLTDKQKSYFEEYYYNDLSITEIAENYQISRNAVFDQIKRVSSILEDYEQKLGLVRKFSILEEIIKDEELRTEILDIMKE